MLLIGDQAKFETTSLFTLGVPFLRAYYSIYDMENNKLGLVGVAETLRSPISDEEEGAEEYILPEPVAEAVEKV